MCSCLNNVLISIVIKDHFHMVLKPGGGKKGVAIRPYPSPGPPPFIPNAFYMCEALAGFDSCWAASRKEEYKLGEIFLLVEKYLRPTNNLS